MPPETPSDPRIPKISAFEANLCREIANLGEQIRTLRGELQQIRSAVIGDGDSRQRPLMQRVAILEEEADQNREPLRSLPPRVVLLEDQVASQRWTMRAIWGALMTLAGNALYSLIHPGK